MSKLVDLARSPAEKKEEAKEYGARPVASSVPDYPYGLSLCFNDETLDKVFGKEMPEVGDEVEITARGVITGVRHSAGREKSDDSRSVDLQVTSIAVDAPDDDKGSLRKTIEKAARK